MNMTAVDRTIRVLCAEVRRNDRGVRDWNLRTEEELLHEACVCMFSSQMVFEVAEAAAERIRDRGLLRVSRYKGSGAEYEQCLRAALPEPLAIERNGKVRHVRPRFRNRLASLLATTVTTMQDQDQSLRRILFSAGSAREAREVLVKQVWGFGPKQASLFLRRVGYSAQLAVLDTHILDYLRLARGIDPKPSALSRLPSYEQIEAEFQRVAAEFGHSVGCVDLAMWVTMRVAKREAIW
jgi:N-glycosylase/DNA lyase